MVEEDSVVEEELEVEKDSVVEEDLVVVVESVVEMDSVEEEELEEEKDSEEQVSSSVSSSISSFIKSQGQPFRARISNTRCDLFRQHDNKYIRPKFSVLCAYFKHSR